jgi:hypothetical protein
MSSEIKRTEWGRFCKKFNATNQFRHITLHITGKNGEQTTGALAPFMGITLRKKGRQIDGFQIFTGWADPEQVTRPVMTIEEPSRILIEKDSDDRDHRLVIHGNGGTTVRIELFGDKTEEMERSLVEQVAYSIYERRGYTDGNDMGDWFEAEQKVRQAEKQLI